MNELFTRNHPALSEDEQARLQKAHVCVVGCGGLGGHIIEYLTRVGVGRFTLVDGDRFEISNLNRQLLSSQSALGREKATAAKERILSINPGADVRAVVSFLDEKNAPQILQGSDIVMDALDSGKARRILSRVCRELDIPMIHGAIQGWNAQIAVCMPGSDLIESLYRDEPAPTDRSCLSFTPGLCAALECAEAVKLLCGQEVSLGGKLLLVDLRNMEFETVQLT